MDICEHVCCVLLYTCGQVVSAVNSLQGQLIITDPLVAFIHNLDTVTYIVSIFQCLSNEVNNSLSLQAQITFTVGLLLLNNVQQFVLLFVQSPNCSIRIYYIRRDFQTRNFVYQMTGILIRVWSESFVSDDVGWGGWEYVRSF